MLMNNFTGLTAVFLIFFTMACESGRQPAVSEDLKLKLASTYYNNGLHEAAVSEYLDYLNTYEIDLQRQANTYYTIANIYFERLKNYEKALEFYFRVKYLYPESPVISEVNRNIVSCLERLQRSKDAARIYEKEAALDPSRVQENKPGKILAEIGDKKITQGDLDYQISRLPAVVQAEIDSKEKKKAILRQIILQDLLYDSAKRQGLENDKDVIEATYQAQKSYMAEKVLQNEIQNNVQINPDDVELYYQAHKERYAEKGDDGKIIRERPFNEVARQVAQDLAMERQNKATNELLERLMKAENVKLYESRVE